MSTAPLHKSEQAEYTVTEGRFSYLYTNSMSLQVDMLVGDIYGDRDYSSIGLSATTIASSFGKVVSQVRAASTLHNAAPHTCEAMCVVILGPLHLGCKCCKV